jgi:hypothetical protein
MLETIRQFAEEQLVASGAAAEARTAHANYFAGRETDILALWDSQRQPEAYTWFAVELPNLRSAFRWAADQGDLDVAAPIATYAAWFGLQTENYEPIAWAEELIEPARAIDHPRLTALYVMASVCYMAGRLEPAIRYPEYLDDVAIGERLGRYHVIAHGPVESDTDDVSIADPSAVVSVHAADGAFRDFHESQVGVACRCGEGDVEGEAVQRYAHGIGHHRRGLREHLALAAHRLG